MESNFGVNVFVSEDILKKAPHCNHGPTLLFQRKTSKGRFYACAASRDRKGCPFFRWEDDWKPDSTHCQSSDMEHRSQFQQTIKKKKHQKVGGVIKSFCQTCNVLAVPQDKAHSGHSVVSLSSSEVNEPSSFLLPLQNDRKEAQYLFADRVVSFMADTLRRLETTSVICIGCPRIHEHVGNSGKIKSLFLDLDIRHQQMYPPEQFCHYNMFNHHFLDGPVSAETYRSFLRGTGSGKVAVVVDPPFGGLLEPLALTLSRIQKDLTDQRFENKVSDLKTDELAVMLIFPYFMEKKALQFLPKFTMLDYTVDYKNHPHYKKYDAGSGQSPVRIFTNVASNRIPLPKEEGYRFCRKCNRYVGSTNKHCDICSNCPTKHGCTYIHCDICSRCVKAGWSHCTTCQRCSMPGHVCFAKDGTAVKAISREGCFNCGDVTHKHKDCPYAGKNGGKRKKNQKGGRFKLQRRS